MSNSDLCFLGLLALACVVVGASPGRTAGVGAKAPPALPRRGSGCPRHAHHRARRRADGAVWCLHCDEAFYPRAAEWDSALRALAV